MKTLYLLRHAHTFAEAPPGKGDHERLLTPEGAGQARQVGRFMKQQNLHPDFLLCSSAARTIETSRLVLDALFGEGNNKIPGRFDRVFYHAPAEKLLAEIGKTAAGVRNLLLVTHNPGAAELALLLGGIDHYSPATLAVFKADCKEWTEFSPDTSRLEQVFVPDV